MNKIRLLSAEKGISASELIEIWAKNIDGKFIRPRRASATI